MPPAPKQQPATAARPESHIDVHPVAYYPVTDRIIFLSRQEGHGIFLPGEYRKKEDFEGASSWIKRKIETLISSRIVREF